MKSAYKKVLLIIPSKVLARGVEAVLAEFPQARIATVCAPMGEGLDTLKQLLVSFAPDDQLFAQRNGDVQPDQRKEAAAAQDEGQGQRIAGMAGGLPIADGDRRPAQHAAAPQRCAEAKQQHQ